MSQDEQRISPDQEPEAWSDAAAAYDEWFAPLTGRFAGDVVEALALGPTVRFLDVAAGTGVLALAAARAGAEVLATDFALGMVEHLQRRFAHEQLHGRVEVMDGQALALPPASFDAAASLFGLIFFPDLAAGTAELHRVLRDGGTVAVTAWAPGGFPLQDLALEALDRVPDPSRPTPAAFRLSDSVRLRALLEDAGFRDVEVREVEHGWRIDDAEALFRSIPGWSAPLRPVFRRLDEGAVASAAARFAELVRARSGVLLMRALLATGTR
ncbi:methyltransferase domain-containing protein [Amnibacterium sp. CER49]|uniref:class I SAM-dependent methyltransferase n=1 Tax=Amnibacterium sp. CER49 TaxID=3039161 RepID=UPI002449B5C4|nr:methyltransferase domain-containing protein [Amnibacterium sp. CER49]MDH2444514.1 methyltransferase domain-containing protein [Amnibacterium sp. CER49]